MGYEDNIVPGEVPNFGAIFMSNIETKKECFHRKLFGLPLAMSKFVLHVKEGLPLFLFEFERRQLFGVFRATSNGELNIEPNAFKSSGKHFPAQVRFTQVWNCRPLDEHEFQDAIRDNYFSKKKFNFGLSEDQVCKLMMLFLTKRIPKKHPARNFRRHSDKPSERDGRFGDHRKNLCRDMLGSVSKDDGHGLDTFTELVGDEVKEVDEHVYLNENFVKEVNNFNCGRGQGKTTVTVERAQKGNDDGFLTNYMTQSDDFGDCGARQAILGKHPDHSLGGIRRVADAGFHFMGDVNDGHEMHNNLGEIRGTTNKDSFSMIEKSKGEHGIEDGYRQIFTEPNGKHFGKIDLASNDAKFLMDGIANKNKDFMDSNRIQDEYHVINGFRESLSAPHLGSPCDRGSQSINDGRLKHNFDEDCSFRSRTLTEHSPSKPRGTAVGIKPGYDEDFGFGSFAPTTHSSIRGVVSTNDIGFSLCKLNTSDSAGNHIYEAEDSSVSEQLRHSYEFSNIGKAYDCTTSYDTTVVTMPIPYNTEIPDIQLSPSSYFAAGRSSSPVDNCPFYQSSKDILPSLLMSKTLPYHSQNEGSMRYFDDHGYALSSKSHHTVSCHETRDTHAVDGNCVFKTASREGSQGPLFPECPLSSTGFETAENVTKGHRLHAFSSSMSSFSAYDNMYLGEPRSKRVSVFDRITSAPEAFKHQQELDSDEKHDLDSSLDKVMKMLEKVVSSPIKRTEKSISAFKQDDDNITASRIGDYELPKVKMEPDVDLSYEVIEGGSLLQETRLVDFKRRKRANKSLDEKSKESSAGPVECERPSGNTASECLAGTASDVGSVEIKCLMGTPCKRRKLVRPVFVRNESTAEGVTAVNNTYNQPTSHENTPSKDDNNSTKAVENMYMKPTSLEETPSKDDNNSTKVFESWEKVDTSIKSIQLPVGCQKSVIEGEASSQVEQTGNAENYQVSDVFIEGRNQREQPEEKRSVDAMPRATSSKDNHKMCGWIEW